LKDIGSQRKAGCCSNYSLANSIRGRGRVPPANECRNDETSHKDVNKLERSRYRTGRFGQIFHSLSVKMPILYSKN